jgi:hypothetical protein
MIKFLKINVKKITHLKKLNGLFIKIWLQAVILLVFYDPETDQKQLRKKNRLKIM